MSYFKGGYILVTESKVQVSFKSWVLKNKSKNSHCGKAPRNQIMGLKYR
jgi:hypothetical protein